VLAPAPSGWRGGALAGKLILQRDGKKANVSVAIGTDATSSTDWLIASKVACRLQPLHPRP